MTKKNGETIIIVFVVIGAALMTYAGCYFFLANKIVSSFSENKLTLQDLENIFSCSAAFIVGIVVKKIVLHLRYKNKLETKGGLR